MKTVAVMSLLPLLIVVQVLNHLLFDEKTNTQLKLMLCILSIFRKTYFLANKNKAHHSLIFILS